MSHHRHFPHYRRFSPLQTTSRRRFTSIPVLFFDYTPSFAFAQDVAPLTCACCTGAGRMTIHPERRIE
ncbi:MAG: hypothetical protein AB1345_12515 [Chloroflexota bacterium]